MLSFKQAYIVHQFLAITWREREREVKDGRDCWNRRYVRQITAVFCESTSGTFLPVQLIYQLQGKHQNVFLQI